MGTVVHLDGYGRVPSDQTPWLHAALTAAHGIGHDVPGRASAMRGAWSLVPHDCPSGWAAVWWDPADGERLAMTSRQARIGSARCVLRFGPSVRIHAPPERARVDHMMKIRALTPVSVARHVDGVRIEREMPTGASVTHALCTLARKLRLDTDGIRADIVSMEVTGRTVALRGKMGRVGGWVGDVSLRCSPRAAWLVDAASRGFGLGSRMAFGLGRVIAR